MHACSEGDCPLGLHVVFLIVKDGCRTPHLADPTPSRLMNIFQDNVSQESLNMFMLGLVKVQGGSSPLLPSHDTLYIDAQKAQRAIEHVFAQARVSCRAGRARAQLPSSNSSWKRSLLLTSKHRIRMQHVIDPCADCKAGCVAGAIHFSSEACP